MDYTINKVSEITGISPYALRYYEKEGLLLNIKRKENGRRVYNEDALSWIEFIKCLRDTGMSINDIKEYMELLNIGDSTVEERKQILMEHRNKLELQMEVIRKSLLKINKKIDWYNGTMQECFCE